jgi:hypothetical protein
MAAAQAIRTAQHRLIRSKSGCGDGGPRPQRHLISKGMPACGARAAYNEHRFGMALDPVTEVIAILARRVDEDSLPFSEQHFNDEARKGERVNPEVTAPQKPAAPFASHWLSSGGGNPVRRPQQLVPAVAGHQHSAQRKTQSCKVDIMTYRRCEALREVAAEHKRPLFAAHRDTFSQLWIVRRQIAGRPRRLRDRPIAVTRARPRAPQSCALGSAISPYAACHATG